MIYVHTHELFRLRNGEQDVNPIIVVDPEAGTAELTQHVEISGPSRLVFQPKPDHGLAPYVWVEADREDLEYEGHPVDFVYAKGVPGYELEREQR